MEFHLKNYCNVLWSLDDISYVAILLWLANSNKNHTLLFGIHQFASCSPPCPNLTPGQRKTARREWNFPASRVVEKMSVHFAKIVQQAKITFDQCNVLQFAGNFSCLQRLVDEMKLEDIRVSPEVASRRSFDVPDKAPCTFIHIYECPVFSMSVFILAENYTMPLHDHPLMHGILKCLSGSVRVQSYSCVREEAPSRLTPTIPVHMSQPKLLDSSSPAAILTPKENNFHEITAVAGAGPGAFFDILSPPYDSPIPAFGKRKCSFYRKSRGLTGDLLLERISTPLHYYCDNIHYDPPQFLRDD